MDKTLIFKSNLSPISSLRRRSSCYNIQRAEERDRRKSAKFECAWISPFEFVFRIKNSDCIEICNGGICMCVVIWSVFFICSVSEDRGDEAVGIVSVPGRLQASHSAASRQLAQP